MQPEQTNVAAPTRVQLAIAQSAGEAAPGAVFAVRRGPRPVERCSAQTWNIGLFRTSVAFGRTGERRRGWPGIHSSSRCVNERRELERKVLGWIVGFLQADVFVLYMEIGRASCRERV